MIPRSCNQEALLALAAFPVFLSEGAFCKYRSTPVRCFLARIFAEILDLLPFVARRQSSAI